MSGETNLAALLANMRPQLADEEYVFVTVPDGSYGDYADAAPIASFVETEGLTLVLEKAQAERSGLSFELAFRRITLEVHSSLEAVGLTAAVASKLTEHGISANVVAAYYHDHIFVQTEQADAAMRALAELS